jgi:hypothetical protein
VPNNIQLPLYVIYHFLGGTRARTQLIMVPCESLRIVLHTRFLKSVVDCIRTTPFRSFMGSAISLRKNKKQTTSRQDEADGASSSLMQVG